MKRAFIFLGLILIVFAGYSFFEYLKFRSDNLRLVFCDVGQGDAIFITTPSGTQILIDGGPDKAVLKCLGDNMPFWDRSIDVVVLTHPHADHFGGLIDVVDRYEIGGFYMEGTDGTSDSYKLLKLRLADANLSAKDLSAGDNFSDQNGVSLEILWPKLTGISKSDLNSTNPDLNGYTIIALLTYKEFSALLTGDANLDSMQEVVKDNKNIDILKVAHHGSKNGTDRKVLHQLNPEVGVITVGENNKYGHPDATILKLFEEQGIKVLRSDLHGEIVVESDGEKFEIRKKL